jgi:putative ABC transport system permease protein
MSELDDSRVDTWMSQNFNTYILLRPGVDAKSLEKRFNEALERYAEPEFKSAVNLSMADLKKGGGYFHCSLMPLTKIHLYSNKPGELGANGNIQYVYIFSAIAMFILSIACINFMNLSTARSANRAKEAGVRKLLGSERKNLIAQFLTESLLISGLSLITALLISWLLIPYLNQLSQKDTSIGIFFTPRFLFFMLSLVFVVGLLAGCYPAFFLSAFKPIEVLKGQLVKGFKGSLLRNVLVVFQFAVSIMLIIGTLVVYSQLRYIHNKDIGFNKEQVLVIQNTGALNNELAPFRNALLQLPGVQNLTVTGFLPVNGYRSNDVFFNDASLDIKRSVSMQKWGVDENYIPTLEIKIVRGRNFSSQSVSDSGGFIINEAAEKYLGGGDPLNKKLYELDDLQTKKIITWHVIGVIKNFNFNSLHDQVSPLALSLRRESGSIALRVNMGNVGTLLTQIKDEWEKMAPSQPLSYTFLDQEFNNQYLADERVGSIAISFSALAILVACLGLFGLVTFAAEQRVKEIGIRKVLGANILDIIGLLSMDLLKLVLLAILIASPVAYWVMDGWLRDFAYRTVINWWVFVLAGSAGFFIAVSTTSYQAIKAASANPVEALRSE